MSGSASELRAVFTAEDRTTPVLRAIGASLRGLVGTGLGRFAATTAELGRGLASMAQGAALTTASLAGLSTAASAAGLASLTTNAATAGAQLATLAETAKVPVATMEELLFTAQRAGVAGDALAGGLGELNTRLRAAAGGGNAELRQVLARLGIALRDTQGHVRGAADILPQLATAFARIQDPALQSRLALAAFGQNGEALVPLLRGGTAALAAGAKGFSAYGNSIAANAGMLAEAQRSFDDLRESATGFTSSVSSAVGAELAPVLAPIASDMAKWIRENREWIATNIAEYIRDTAIAVRDFFKSQENRDRLRDFATSVRALATALGGLKGIMIGFGAIVVAPFVAALLSIVTNFGLVIGVIGRLSLVLLTTPFGWFLASVAAVATAGYLIYSNWDRIGTWFRGIWTRVYSAWAPQVTEILGVIGSVARAVVEVLRPAWEPVVGFFSGVLDNVLKVFQEKFAAILEIVARIREAAEWLQSLSPGTGGTAFTPDAQRQRATNFRDRGNPGGYYPAEPRPVMPGFVSDSGLYIGQAARGSIEATIRFENAPPGTRVEAAGTGIVQQPRTDLGLNLRTRLP